MYMKVSCCCDSRSYCVRRTSIPADHSTVSSGQQSACVFYLFAVSN